LVHRAREALGDLPAAVETERARRVQRADGGHRAGGQGDEAGPDSPALGGPLVAIRQPRRIVEPGRRPADDQQRQQGEQRGRRKRDQERSCGAWAAAAERFRARGESAQIDRSGSEWGSGAAASARTGSRTTNCDCGRTLSSGRWRRARTGGDDRPAFGGDADRDGVSRTAVHPLDDPVSDEAAPRSIREQRDRRLGEPGRGVIHDGENIHQLVGQARGHSIRSAGAVACGHCRSSQQVRP
jgi:hypothetical protein